MILMTVLAFLWALGASAGLVDTMSMLLGIGASMLVTVVVLMIATRMGFSETPETPVSARQGRRFTLVGVLQVVVIAAVVVVLVLLGLPEFVPAGVCLVVGAHFFPLAAVFGRSLYVWTGVLLCGIAGAGAALALSGDAELSRTAVGFAAAGVLWVSALFVSRPHRDRSGSGVRETV
ncbi:hypothetical protein [Thermobifida halotolerans]|nr:hypothetical protein [Thermobifida halotolerans]